MANKDIERRIKSAFEKTVPDVLDSVLEHCSEQKGQITMTENKRKRIPILKIAVIAAALVLVCAATVTAINLSNLIGEDEALRIAENYVVMNETDEEVKNVLAESILMGLVYDEELGAGEADLGLSAGRFVYNVSFKTGGYSFKVTVDAKTGVVLNCEREVDENWENVYDGLKEDSENRIEEIKKEQEREQAELEASMPKIRDIQLREIFIDHFGLHHSLRSKESFSELAWLTWDSESGLVTATMTIDGYIYTCNIDGTTGEVSNDTVAEDPDYTGERHLYQHIDGIISLYEAVKLGEKAIGVTEEDYYYGYASAAYYPSELDYIDYDVDVIYVHFTLNGTLDAPYYEVILDAKTGEVIEIIEKINISDAVRIVKEAADISEYNSSSTHENENRQYEVHIESEKLGKAADGIVDAVTGEVISVETYDIIQKDGKPSADTLKNQTLNTESPEGMISEAVAAAIALENSGVNEQCVWALKVNLEDGAYKISYWFGYDDFNERTSIGDYRTNTYEIDAVTGEILSFDAFTPDDYIGEEAALAIAYESAGIGREEVLEETIKFENTMMGYPSYSVVLYTETIIYRYQLDAVNGFDHIVR